MLIIALHNRIRVKNWCKVKFKFYVFKIAKLSSIKLYHYPFIRFVIWSYIYLTH